MPEIDFAGVGEPKEWRPAPSGDYILQLVSAEDGFTKSGKNAGKPNTALQFEIVDCEGELEEFNGRTIYYYATYGEGGLPQLKRLLKAFGADVDDSPGAEPLKFEWDELIGLKVRASLKIEPASKNSETGAEYGPKNAVRRFIVPGAKG